MSRNLHCRQSSGNCPLADKTSNHEHEEFEFPFQIIEFSG